MAKKSVYKKKLLDSILIKPAGPDCNLACTYCFYRKKMALFPEARIHRMSEAALEETIRQVMSQPAPVSIAWQGGEPTLMGLPFFQKAVDLQIKYGKGKSVSNGFQTNGLLVDKSWAAFFKKYQFLVGISLDGPEKVHDRYRRSASGRRTWQKTVDAARLLLDAGVAVDALVVVTDFSAHFPDEIYGFLKTIGLIHMQFIPCFETDVDDRSKAAPYSVSAEALGRFLRRLFDLWLSDFRDGVPTTFIRWFDALFYRYVDREPLDCDLLAECGNYLVVEHNGDVFACDFFVEPDWKLGNVMDGKLVHMLNSARQREFGRMKSALPDQCSACNWLWICRGGCTKDRLRDPRDARLNHFCGAFKEFFAHANEKMRILAREWKDRDA